MVKPHKANLQRGGHLADAQQPAALLCRKACTVAFARRAGGDGFQACKHLLLLLHLVQQA